MKIKKFLASALSLLFVFSFAACGPNERGEGGEEEDPNDNRTRLTIGVYDGAVGYAWADELEKEYEALHKDVNVVIRHKRGDYDDTSLLSRIPYNTEDIYFGAVNSLQNLVLKGHVEDLTSLAREKCYDDDGNLVESGATKSIEDRLWDPWEAFNKIDGKYYGLPNFTPPAGISYDADLFEQKGYAVPKTYSEFKDLMDRMVSDGITPMTIADHEYIWFAAIAFWANKEGVNNFSLNSTFSGTDSNLGEITPATATKLLDQEGFKAYLQFYKDLASRPDYTTAQTKGSQTNVASQSSFISSITKPQRVAMILENSFWERESYSTFVQLGRIKEEYGWGKRNLKFMIAPVDGKAEGENQTVYLTYPNSHLFVSKYSKQKDLAFDFIKFSLSRKALASYVVNTGVLRPYEFTATEEEKQSATPFVRSILDLLERDDVDFVTMGAATKEGMRIGVGSIYVSEWGSRSNVSGVGATQMFPFRTFSTAATSSVTVDQYFDGRKAYVVNKYSSLFGNGN